MKIKNFIENIDRELFKNQKLSFELVCFQKKAIFAPLN
jgi:hypothetical protein